MRLPAASPARSRNAKTEEPSMPRLTPLVVVVSIATVTIAAEQETPPPSPPAYLLRADSRWAKAIDAVLARSALRTELTIPPNRSAEEYLAEMCAGDRPPYEPAPNSTPSGLSVVRAAPCVRVRRDVKVPVRLGDTLEG